MIDGSRYPAGILLASRSPRRAELLRQIGVAFSVIDVEVMETWDGRESAADYVSRLAGEKAQAGKTRHPAAVVLGADTAVVVDGVILGKPRDREHARAMLLSLSGREHSVYSGVAVCGDRLDYRVNVTQVWFGELAERDLTEYLATAEPWDKAGGYGIQGLAARHIVRIEGSYSGVMGLPLYETDQLLTAVTGA